MGKKRSVYEKTERCGNNRREQENKDISPEVESKEPFSVPCNGLLI